MTLILDLMKAGLRIAAPAFLCLMLGATPAAAASIADAAWLAGSWDGEGMGGRVQESWSQPVGGQMLGQFALSMEGKPVFYLVMLIDEHAGGLRFRVKHLEPTFATREDRDQSLEFAFVEAAPDGLVFKGMSLVRQGADGLVIIVRMTQGGVARDLVQTYRRVKP